MLLTDHEAKNTEKNLRAVVVGVVWHGSTTILIELFGPIHYQWDRDASDKKYIDAIFVVVGTMLYGSTTALLNYLVPFIINGSGILPTRNILKSWCWTGRESKFIRSGIKFLKN